VRAYVSASLLQFGAVAQPVATCKQPEATPGSVTLAGFGTHETHSSRVTWMKEPAFIKSRMAQLLQPKAVLPSPTNKLNDTQHNPPTPLHPQPRTWPTYTHTEHPHTCSTHTSKHHDRQNKKPCGAPCCAHHTSSWLAYVVKMLVSNLV
jgi:hypothetical protein